MKLNDLQLYKENNQYYLSATFFYEDKKGYYELTVPKIKLPVSQNCEVNLSSGWNNPNQPYHIVSMDLGFGLLYAKQNDKGDFATFTCLEEKVHEMTLAEIEKELGYKIKLRRTNK